MRARPNLPIPPVAGKSGYRLRALARFTTLLVPQTLLSAIAIGVYVRAFGFFYARWLVWSHLLEIAALQVGFFLGWGWLAGRGRAKTSRWAPRLFAASLVLAGFGLNFIYAGQLLTEYIWADPLSLAIVRTWPRQAAGLVAAYGPVVVLMGAAALLVLLAIAGTALWQARRLWQWLCWAAPGPDFFARLGRRAALLVGAVAVVGGLAASRWIESGHGGVLLLGHRHDPVFGLLLAPVKISSVPAGGVEADLRARRDYPAVVPGARRRNVVVVVIDDLRADHLPMFGYRRDTAPFLRELAASGRLQAVDRTVPVSNATRNSVLGLLASRTPEGISVGNFRLQDVLKRQGYRTRFIGGGDHSTFADLRRFYGDSLDFFTDGTSGRYSVNDDRNVLDAVDRLPASDGTPTFLYLHLMSVHTLGVRLPEWARWSPAPEHNWTPGALAAARDPARAADNYDNGVLQADAYLRRIFSVLEARGYLRDFVGVITADHGESLGAHGVFGHGESFYNAELTVPLFFLESGAFRSGRIAFASEVDIAPTLLDRLGLPVPESWQGHSLLAGPRRAPAFFAASWPGRWCGLVQASGEPRYKYVVTPRADGGVEENLFDEAGDPGEDVDLHTRVSPVLLREFRREVSTHFHLSLPP